MAWFEHVANEIAVTRRGFILADEAVSMREFEKFGQDVMDSPSYAERPSPDWGASKVLVMAALQLDQMIDLVGRVIGQEVSGWDAGKVSAALERRVRELPTLQPEDWAFEIAGLGDGVELRRALEGVPWIRHGYAVDGSIAMTIGPRIPGMDYLGLRGSEEGEMEDEPDRIFDLAVDLTQAAVLLLEAVKDAQSRADARS